MASLTGQLYKTLNNSGEATMADRSSRRRFIRDVAAASAAVSGVGVNALSAQQAGRIRGYDHVALPMENTDAMLAFYRALGCDVSESPNSCSVYFGDNMINFHRPVLWQRESFTLRAPAAKPPCGDLCFVWEGTPRVFESYAGPRWGKGRVRSGGKAGRPPEDSFERLRARSRREPPRIHDLPLSSTGSPSATISGGGSGSN